MTKTVSQFKDELADREAIRDCLYRYARGVDRQDMDMLASAYWPGAMDYHTGFTGTVEEFIAWAAPRLKAMEHNVHMIGNIFIRIEGANAKVESYFWGASVIPGTGVREIVTAGRYLDKFERRNDEWRIAERFVVHEWFHQANTTGDWAIGPFGMSGLPVGGVQPDDRSYTWLGLR